MGEVLRFMSKKERRVDELCKAVAVNEEGINEGESQDILGSVHTRLGEMNFHWSADEAEEIALGMLKAAARARANDE